MTCAACQIDDRTKECELVNGSLLLLCQPCRVRYDVLIAATPIDDAEDRRAEEEAAVSGAHGYLADAAATIAELLVTYDDKRVFATARVRARNWLREYAASRPFSH